MSKTIPGWVIQLALFGIAGYILYQWLKKNSSLFNPASDQNLAYQGANKLLQAVTGDPVDTVGTMIYNLINSQQFTPYLYSTSQHKWAQVQRLSDGAIFNINADGTIDLTNPVS